MRRTILLADDSSTIQRLVTQTFADADYEVVAVSNGAAAIRKFEEVQPDVVLADIYMPGKNGYEVSSYVKSHPSLAATPVILLIGAFDVFDEEAARRAEATASIMKPFEPRSLVDLVDSVLIERIEPLRADAASAAAGADAVSSAESADSNDSNDSNDGAPPAESVAVSDMPDEADLMGLSALFTPPSTAAAGGAIGEEEINRIAGRVIQKVSTQLIESIAWDVVPEIVERVLREELKKTSQSKA